MVERKKDITVPCQHGLNTMLLAEQAMQSPPHLQNDIFLTGTVFAYRAWVLPAMTRVDDHNHITQIAI